MVDHSQISQSIFSIIQAIGEDTEREGLIGTPDRVARLYQELFWGIGLDPKEAFTAVFEEPLGEGVVLLKDIKFFSICEHHFLPFIGTAQIGYIPNGRISGASKLVRALEILARRPQIQERMTSDFAESICTALGADGVAVALEAEHMCMTIRGVKSPGGRIVTTAVRGPFANGSMNSKELLALVRGT